MASDLLYTLVFGGFMNTTKYIQASILVGLAVFGMLGCGARNTSTGDSTNLSSTSGVTAYCNEYKGANIDVKVSSIYNQTGGIDPSKVRLKIITPPATYGTVPTQGTPVSYDMVIKKWTVDAAGSIVYSDAYPEIYFDHYDGPGSYTRVWASGSNGTTPYNQKSSPLTLEWSVIKNVLPSGSPITTPLAFFSQYQMLADLKDPTGQWKGLEINYYKYTYASDLVTLNATEKVFTVSFLIPAFDADPASYAAGHPASLSSLHPFNALSGLLPSQYQAMANDFCF